MTVNRILEKLFLCAHAPKQLLSAIKKSTKLNVSLANLVIVTIISVIKETMTTIFPQHVLFNILKNNNVVDKL